MPKPTRKALLIGPNYQDSKEWDLPGTPQDLSNMREFLLTFGGFEIDTEIVTLDWNAQHPEVCNQLNDASDVDYLLVYFTGHGFLNHYGETLLLLSDGKFLSDREVRKHAKRQLNIFDCCRVGNLNFAPDAADSDGPVWNVPPPSADMDKNRLHFGGLLEQAECGEITIFACSPREYARSGPRLGSRFTYGLTKTAIAALANGYTPVEMTVHQVFSLTEQWVQANSGYTQNPTIESDPLDFPFAVLV